MGGGRGRGEGEVPSFVMIIDSSVFVLLTTSNCTN